MSERDNDFEFDFFEEPETREGPPTERIPRVGPRGPTSRPPTHFTPLLRLVGLIAFAILIVVLLVFWVNSCQDGGKRASYERYLERLRVVATSSDRLGREMNGLLTTPGIKPAELEQRLRGLAQQQLQDTATAQEIRAPGPLRMQQQFAVEALRLRASGVKRLADALRLTASSRNTARASRLLADQATRLVASDVMWEDLFRAPATDELKKEDITGVTVPDSNFVVNPDLASSRAWASVFQRVVGGASTGGSDGLLHGTQLISVVALPKGQRLTPSSSSATPNTVVASPDLAFEVTVEDSGDAQEVQVPVVITIALPKPIVKKQFIDLINPGEQAKVVFRNIDLPSGAFAREVKLRVEVQPVPGETRTDNNSAEYPVIFSLG
jgi:hypothetical protein